MPGPDFEGLARQLLASAESHLASWLPAGRKRGNAWVAGDLSGAAGQSLKINLSNGAWSDFATGDHGSDLISLYAAIHGLSMGEAHRQLGGESKPAARVNGTHRPAPPAEPARRVVTPVPEASADCACVHPHLGKPSHRWTYFDGNGEVLGYVARYDPAGERKQLIPWTWDGGAWGMGQWPAPRPLYGLQELAARPDAAVLVVEGEKAADAARRFATPYVVITWPAGAMAVDKADWKPLKGRKVLMWPDADEPGKKAMQRVAQIIAADAAEVKVLDVSGQPDGWDAADAGFDSWQQCKAWMVERASVYVPPTESIDPETGEIHPSVPEYRTAEEVERMNLPAKFQGPPIDVFGDAPVPEIDRAMLPAAIADYAFDQAELMGVAPGMIAMPCIVACASVIHDGIELQPKRHETGWRESARLWCAVVGSPSVRKSPSLRRAISRLKKINRELCEANDRKQAAYAHEVEEWQDAKRAAKRHNETPPQAPEDPVKERLIVEDITVEAMSEILKHNARGVLCVQDELTGWFGAMDAYNAGKAAGKDRAHWLEMYNGGHHMVDRVLRGSIHVPNWSACMVGGIQPDMIRRIASQMGEDGLMQRFMVIMGRNAGNEQDRPEDERAKRAYNGLIDHLYGIQPGNEPVMMSEEAHLVRERVFDYAKEMTEYDAIPNGLKSHIGKWPGLFSRIALTYHVIDCAARGKHPNAENISGKTAECVERLMREYLLPHSMSYYTDILGQESHLEHVRWIAGHILSKKVERLENREIVQAYKQWRGLQEWVRTRVLATLQELGWIMPAEGQPAVGKKPPTVWDVNPTAHEHYEQLAEREREKRQRLTERMRELGR